VFPADAIRIGSELPRDSDIKIVPYAHPTVHVLVPNLQNPFLANPNFRRALVFAIDRERILLEELLGGREQLGSGVISGPFPASSSESDPLGYAYDETIRPWTHNALLAKVLSIVATKEVVELAKKRGESEPKLTRLVLGFPGGEIARIGSQAAQAYLKVIGIEVDLKEFPPGVTEDVSGECDLVYKEVAIWEPVTDARRMLGPRGVAPTQSPYVAQSLRRLEEARNWGDIRDRLLDIHRAVYNDVAIMPLWQVVDYFAYHKRIRNIGERPVWLYQNVEQWRIGTDTVAQK
jgi:ABC-type transport system substrate-binding protein